MQYKYTSAHFGTGAGIKSPDSHIHIKVKQNKAINESFRTGTLNEFLSLYF